MGVACPNAQLVTSEQEDDLEHTGLSFFSHSQRQHAYLTGSCAQAQGTSSASSPRIQYRCSLYTGRHAKTTLGPALSLMGLIQVVASLRTERSAYIDVVAGMSLTSGRERLPVS